MRKHPIVLAILLGAAIAGTLDLTYAFLFFGAKGISPERILQSIASGLLGADSYRGGVPTATLGAFLHYFILGVAATIFYAASTKLAWLTQKPVVSGVAFGLAIYAFMNFVVVPLSAFPHKQSFPLLTTVTGILIHMFGVGLPIALCVRNGVAKPRG